MQTEDGIRDFGLSRGLGDEDKRQLQDSRTAPRLAGVQLNDVADITGGFTPSRVLLDVQLTDFKFKFLL